MTGASNADGKAYDIIEGDYINGDSGDKWTKEHIEVVRNLDILASDWYNRTSISGEAIYQKFKLTSSEKIAEYERDGKLEEKKLAEEQNKRVIQVFLQFMIAEHRYSSYGSLLEQIKAEMAEGSLTQSVVLLIEPMVGLNFQEAGKTTRELVTIRNFEQIMLQEPNLFPEETDSYKLRKEITSPYGQYDKVVSAILGNRQGNSLTSSVAKKLYYTGPVKDEYEIAYADEDSFQYGFGTISFNLANDSGLKIVKVKDTIKDGHLISTETTLTKEGQLEEYVITDEGGFKVTEWFTNIDKPVYEIEEDTPWGDIKDEKFKPRDENGEEPETIEVKVPEDADEEVIYIHYVKEDNGIEVVKVFDTIKNGRLNHDKTTLEKISPSPQQYAIKNEGGYKVQDWFEVLDKSKPGVNNRTTWESVLTENPVDERGFGLGKVDTDDSPETIYIHYVREEPEDQETTGDELILTEKRISRQYTISELEEMGLVEWLEATTGIDDPYPTACCICGGCIGGSCSGCSCCNYTWTDDDGDEHTVTCSCRDSFLKWNDGKYRVVFRNQENTDVLVVANPKWESTGEYAGVFKPDYEWYYAEEDKSGTDEAHELYPESFFTPGKFKTITVKEFSDYSGKMEDVEKDVGGMYPDMTFVVYRGYGLPTLAKYAYEIDDRVALGVHDKVLVYTVEPKRFFFLCRKINS